jgi:hypothetical protein
VALAEKSTYIFAAAEVRVQQPRSTSNVDVVHTKHVRFVETARVRVEQALSMINTDLVSATFKTVEIRAE